MMNVAATRAKKEFYIIGDKKLYLGLGCDVARDTYDIISQYNRQHPDLVDDEDVVIQADASHTIVPEADSKRVIGKIKYVGMGKGTFYAYVSGDDGREYTITESIYSETEHAVEVIKKENIISFVPEEGKTKPIATDVKQEREST